jgi:hypothetical protein
MNVKKVQFIYNSIIFFMGTDIELKARFLELRLEQNFAISQWLIEYHLTILDATHI